MDSNPDEGAVEVSEGAIESEIGEGEQRLVSHLRGLKAQTSRFDGRCGEIIDVSPVSEIEMNDGFEKAVEELHNVSQRLEEAKESDRDVILTGNNVLTVNDTLASLANVKADDSDEVVVTVSLPGEFGERTFSQTFDVPTFESEEIDNELSTLYHDVLGLDANRNEPLTGNWVPVKESAGAGKGEFVIDIDRVADGGSSSSATSGMVENAKEVAPGSILSFEPEPPAVMVGGIMMVLMAVLVTSMLFAA